MRTRTDPFVWLGCASSAGAAIVVAPLASSIVAAIVVGLHLRDGRRALVLAMMIVCAVSGVRAHGAIARHERARSAMLGERWPARCVVEGRVTRSPAMIGGGLRVDVEGETIACGEGEKLPSSAITLHVPSDVEVTLARGDRIVAHASLAPPYRFWNDGVGDPRPSSARRGVVLSGGAEDVRVVRAGWGVLWGIDRARAHLRVHILRSFPAETSPMARALVLGEDDLPDVDQTAFRRSGLAHLLAVSGMHLVLVVMGFVAAMRALLLRVEVLAARLDVGRIAAALALPLAWGYAELAGGSGSAIRAAWMCTVALLAHVLARRSAAWRALGLSLLAMSLVDPLVVFDLSFVLSAVATTGLLALAGPIERVLHARLPLPAFVVRPLATTAAATIACAPVLARISPELSLSGIVANVVAVPIGEAVALPLCLAHGLLAGWPAAEQGCANVASGALLVVRFVARAFSWGALPIPPPTAEQLGAIVAGAAGASLGRPRACIALGVVALVVLEIAARREGVPSGVLRVTFLDVGQGDAALVDLPDGSAMLVDGGGLVGSPIDVGERAVAPLLAARRRGSLAAVVLTHPHPDHLLGLASGLARVEAATLWDNGQGEAEGTAGAYADVLSTIRARGVRVLRPADLCGSRPFGGAWLDVVAPCPGITPDRGANDNSFVFRLRFGERSVLFTGDAEREEEHELLARRAELRADVLKVGHHGSRTSSSAPFLQAVKPSVAVISCGVRNRYGHPHERTLAALADAGARVLRTDRDGSVVVTTDGRSLDVRTIAR